MIRKMKLLFILGIAVSFFVISTMGVSANNGQKFEINHFKNEDEETYQIFGLNNYRRQRTSSTELNTILEGYPINIESFNNSENVYLSISTFYRLGPDIAFDQDLGGGGGSTSNSKYGEVSYSDSEGYLKKVLVVYDKGYVRSGEKLFETVVYVDFHKTFSMRNTDSLVIWSGNNSVLDYNYTHYGYLDYTKTFANLTEAGRNVASIDYSYTNGVRYDIQLPKKNTPAGVNTQDWYCEGNYYFIATATTNVNSTYIHNEKIFGGNLSISIGYFGITISGNNTQYNGGGVTIYV